MKVMVVPIPLLRCSHTLWCGMQTCPRFQACVLFEEWLRDWDETWIISNDEMTNPGWIDKDSSFSFCIQGPVSFPCWASLWTSCSGGTTGEGFDEMVCWIGNQGTPQGGDLNKKFIAIIVFSFLGSLEFSTHFSKPLWALVSFGCHLALQAYGVCFCVDNFQAVMLVIMAFLKHLPVSIHLLPL